MGKLVITRPNGEIEYAELTTDKLLAGNDCLTVEKAGTVYYAKLDNGVSTHMYVIKPDGRKLYVQETLAVSVNFDYREYGNGNPSQLYFNMDNPRPKSIGGVSLYGLQKAETGTDTRVNLNINYRWTGEITVRLKTMKAVFKYQNSTSATVDVGKQGIDIIRAYAKNIPFQVSVTPK